MFWQIKLSCWKPHGSSQIYIFFDVKLFFFNYTCPILLENDPEATGPLSRWVRDRRIALEVCPCSNLQTGAISHWGESIKEHPITQLHRAGFTVTLSPDNRLMSATSVSHEMSLLLSEAGWSNRELAEIQHNAARAAFVPRAYQDWLAGRIEEASA